MALEDSFKKLRIKHPGLHKPDHPVMLLGSAHLKADGRHTLRREHTRCDAIGPSVSSVPPTRWAEPLVPVS